MTEMQNTSPRNILSESIMLSAIPVIGYASAILYEEGYAFHFGMPYEFIQVSIKEIILTVLSVCFLYLYLFKPPNLCISLLVRK